MTLLAIGSEYDARIIDIARRALDDIPQCARAEVKVRWTENAGGVVPVLWIAFCQSDLEKPLPEENRGELGQTLAAVTVRMATLPSNAAIDGDRARAHIRRSVENYLARHGILLPAVEPSPGELS